MASDKAVIYIHGKGGNAGEAERYKPLFPCRDVIGFDYRSLTPWEAAEEFPRYFDALAAGYRKTSIIANSIGAYFTLTALSGRSIEKACFVSPIVDMESLILEMMAGAGISEDALKARGTVETPFGEVLSWEYLSWVRTHPVSWNIPTAIAYGENDALQTFRTVAAFAERTGAAVSVMPCGEHWFHTDDQMRFLDGWLRKAFP